LNVTPAQLKKQLKEGIAPVYFVAGDEPLLINEVLDSIRSAARADGYEDREVFLANASFDWDLLRSGMSNMSLFAARRIIEVRLPTGKPGRVGGAMLAELAADPAPDTLLLVIAEQFDNKTAKAKWAKTLAELGVAVVVKPVSPEQLPVWLGRTVKQQGLVFSDAALELLAHHVEGNLLAAKQEIDKLALIAPDGQVDEDLVQQSVADGARFDVFQLSETVLAADQSRAIRILYGLRTEGIAAPLVLWVLAREATTLASAHAKLESGMPMGKALQEAGVWRSRQGPVGQCLKRHNADSIAYLLSAACAADKIVKGGQQGEPWGALLELVQAIGQPQLQIRGQLSA